MRKKPTKFRGKTYASISDLAREFDMRPGTVIARLNKGMSLAQALVKDRPRKDKKAIRIDGLTFSSHSAAAEHFGLGLTTLKDRIERQGMTPEQAVRAEKRYVPRVVTLEGVRYRTVKDACDAYRISQIKVANRMSTGWSIRQAFEISARPDTDVAGVIYVVKNTPTGKRYVGHTRTTIEKRWDRHVWKAESGDYSPNSLAAAIAKLGPERFTRRVLEQSDGSLNQLLKLERKYIRKLNTRWPDGYNLSSGGEYAKVDRTKYEVEGRHFASIREVAGHYGLTRSALSARLDRGSTIEEAVHQKNRYRNYVLKGKQFSGLKEACAYYAKNLGTVKARLERGWTLEQAFDLAHRDGKRGPVQVKAGGVKYPSISAAARAYGLEYYLVKARMRSAWSIAQALGIKPAPRNLHGPKPINIERMKFPTLADAARHYGFDPLVVRTRINKHGWSIEEALGVTPRTPPRPGRKVKVGGVSYPSIVAASEAFNQNPKVVRSRLRYGWTMRQALGVDKRPKRKKTGG